MSNVLAPRSPQCSVLLVIAALAACGDSGPSAVAPAKAATVAPQAKASKATAAASGNLTAEDVARAARGDLRCPPAAAPARAAGAPVDDIVGVRPGMTWDEAARIIMCTDPLMVATADMGNRFSIKSYGQQIRQGLSAGHAQPRVQKTGQQVMKELSASTMARANNQARPGLAPGTSRWYLGTMGVPGEERVAYIQREERFDDAALPPLQTVEQALLAKYGPPTRRSPLPDGLEMVWAHDAGGRPRRGSSPTSDHCGMNAHIGGAVQLREDCGVVVSARVRSAPNNPAIAQSITVGAIDQARGFALIRQTEQRLEQAESERQARQLKDASKNAKAPTL